MKKAVSIVTLSAWVALSLCAVLNSGESFVGSTAMQMEHGAGHGAEHGKSKHGISEMSMGCCAIVSGGVIMPQQTLVPLLLASIAFLLVYNFFAPPQIYIPLFRPPRSRSLFQ